VLNPSFRRSPYQKYALLVADMEKSEEAHNENPVHLKFDAIYEQKASEDLLVANAKVLLLGLEERVSVGGSLLGLAKRSRSYLLSLRCGFGHFWLCRKTFQCSPRD